MPRVKRGTRGAKRRGRIIKKAEGFYAGRGKLMKTAKQSVDRAMQMAFVGRKLKKREYRRLWQTRIAAAAQLEGVSYSRLMGNLKKRGIELDRKMLALMAVASPKDFAAVVALAKG